MDAGDFAGTGLADPAGRLWWVDDALCAGVGRSRRRLLGAMLDEVPGLAFVDIADAAGGRAALQLPGRDDAPVAMLRPLGPPDGPPWALIVEVKGRDPVRESEAKTTVTFFALDRDHRIVAVDGPGAASVGLTPAAVGRTIDEVIDAPAIRDLAERAFQGRPAATLAIQQDSTIETHLFPVSSGDGPPSGLVGVASLRQVSGAPHTVELTDDEGEPEHGLEVALMRKARPLLEATAQVILEILGGTACGVFEYLPDGTGLVLRGAARRPAEGPDPPPDALPFARPDGRARSLVVPIETTALSGYLVVSGSAERAFTVEDERCAMAATQLLGIGLDLLATGESERRAALHDPVTGLPSRSLILDHLRTTVERAGRQGTGVAVLFVDLARFKLVNDTLGHQAGDAMLAAAAGRMRAALRPSDTLGRLAGDEFLVVCDGLTERSDALAVARRLAAAFAEPFCLGGVEVSLRADVGVAYAVGTARTGDALLAEADAAMYWAKRRGWGVAFFDEAMEASVAEERCGGSAGSAGTPAPGSLGELVSRLVGLLGDLGDAEAASQQSAEGSVRR
jgi:diguanylate cyclase (GGDEF)-like protein